MDTKVYKKNAWKLGLWFGSVTIAYVIIALILFFTLPITNAKVRIGFALELCFAAILLYLLFLCFTLNRIFYRILITPAIIEYNDDTTELQFKVSGFAHIFITLISLILFFLIISCHSMALKINWGNAALATLPVSITTLIWSYLFMYFYIYTFNYVLNKNEDLKSNLLKTITENQKQGSD
jgi:hypothetical protein